MNVSDEDDKILKSVSVEGSFETIIVNGYVWHGRCDMFTTKLCHKMTIRTWPAYK